MTFFCWFQGMADTFILLGMAFDSPEAAQLNKEIFETIYFAALETSCSLAEQEGTYLPACSADLQRLHKCHVTAAIHVFPQKREISLAAVALIIMATVSGREHLAQKMDFLQGVALTWLG